MLDNIYTIVTWLWRIVVLYYTLQFGRLLLFKKPQQRSIMIIFGSGGHTTEMLMLFKNFDFSQYGNKKIHFIIANTDTTSRAKILDYIQNNQVNINVDYINWVVIPRSREVGQSYITSIVTTLHAFFTAYWKITSLGAIETTVSNGPGTAIPVIAIQVINKLLLIQPRVKIVFVESFCRVKTLSFSGKILYYLRITDKFIVHWPEQARMFGRSKYIGTLI